MSGEAQEYPLSERWRLAIRKCWVPECPGIALWRDGSGWWWCADHRDERSMWGIAETTTHADLIANIETHLATARALLRPADGESA